MKIKKWQVYLGLVISAVFLYFAFRKVDFSSVWQHLKSAQWGWVLPGLGFYFIGVLLRAWRWQVLLNPIQKIPLKRLFSVVCIGYMGNNVYPARMGEVLRSLLLKQKENLPISASLATIVVERLFDGITVLALVLPNLGVLSQINPDSAWLGTLQKGSLWVGLAFGVLLLAFIAVVLLPKQAKVCTDWLVNRLLPMRWRKNIASVIDKFIAGLSILRSAQQSLLVLALSLGVWLMEAGLYWGVSQALGLNLGLRSLLLVEGVVNLVLLVPAAPGGLGTFDAATKAMLELFNIASEQALGYALVLRVALWVPITVLGAILLVREGFGLNGDLRQLQQNYQDEETKIQENS